MTDPVESFNGVIKTIFDKFKDLPSKKTFSGTYISETRKEMLRAMSLTPEYAIQVIGPYIWNRRKEIDSGEEKWFITHNYGSVIMQLSMKHKFIYEDAIKAIEFMKDAFGNAKDAQRKDIVECVQKLLQSYAGYLAAGKAVKARATTVAATAAAAAVTTSTESKT